MSEISRFTVGPTDIAIIGMAGRFPGCRDVDQFWQKIHDGVECIRSVTDDELILAGVDPVALRDSRYVKVTGDLADVGGFDASFFGYSPKDAAILDPQHRHFYECAWAGLEQSGHTPARFPGRIGVFAGCGPNLYFMRNVLPNPELQRSVGYFLLRHTGNDRDFLPTGVSYKLNLHGPSIAVQTACSTSLVAIHVASQSLLNGECDIALAGGVTIEVPHGQGYIYRANEILSPDGHCRPFDESAGGTVLSSGCGVVVLRRAEEALDDQDYIHAIVRGSAVNNDGANKVGYLAPSVQGHADVVDEALAVAGLTADDISYLETHGTGTGVGDPIEVAALTQAFRRSTDRRQFCPIGSVKSNIGHTDTAAGVASVIKVVEALKHKEIPKSLNYRAPNPSINFSESPFYVSSEHADWMTDGRPRRAGVSSLGVGGTNAHAILEEAPPRIASDPAAPWQTLLFSAKSNSALDQMMSNLSEYLRKEPEINLADVAYTLQYGRTEFEHRRAVVVKDTSDAIDVCETRDAKRISVGKAVSGDSSLVFMFPGGGVQYPNMGRDLYDAEDVYREAVDECLQLLAPQIDCDLRNLMFPALGKEEEAADQLREVCASICAIFVVEYATAQLFLSWGLQPTAMTGHSLGEYTAACLAGVMPLSDALKIVALRGRLLRRTANASMISVSLSEAEVAEFLNTELDLAAVNGPSLCLISGPNSALEVLQQTLEKREIGFRRLHLSAASHCRLVDPVLDEFRAGIQSVHMSPPKLPFISNETGTWVRAEEVVDPEYWVRHFRQCVQFAAGLSELCRMPSPIFLEVGPGRTLASLALQQESKPWAVITSIRHPDESINDVQFARTALGRLWIAGLNPDWSKLDGSPRRQRLPLPTYPFEHQHYWIEPVPVGSAAAKPTREVEKLSSPDEWLFKPIWKRTSDSPAAEIEKSDAASVTLIFLDPVGLGHRIAEQLRAEGETIVTVREGDAFYKFSDFEYALSAEEGRTGYDELIAELAGADLLPNRILHMWLVTSDEVCRPGSSFYHRNMERGVYSLIFLAQALGEQELNSNVHISVVSNDIQSVNGELVLYPEKATVLGPVRVIPREFDHITCSSIDISLPRGRRRWGTFVRPKQDSEETERLVLQLLAELRADAGNRTIALRDQSRYELTYSAAKSQTLSGHSRLKKGGTYLITGGLGGIGLLLAGFLARKYQAKLLLVGRSGLPKRDEWASWCESHSSRDPISRTIRTVREMEARGGAVMIESADVANVQDLQYLLDKAQKCYGRIDGVFHAAGVLDDGVLQGKTAESIDRVLSPKVQGTLLLGELLAERKPDFTVLFSSTSAIFGPAGQADYAAANCFLNAFADTEAGRRINALAVNWGIWKHVGMGSHVAARLNNETIEASHQRRRISHPLLEECVNDDPERVVFISGLSVDRSWVVDEHRTRSGQAILPGTGYLEIASAAFREASGTDQCEISDLSLVAPLSIGDFEIRELQTVLSRSAQENKIDIKSQANGDWILHATGKISSLNGDSRRTVINLQPILERCSTPLHIDDNGLLTCRQMELLQFGSRWRILRLARRGVHEAIAELSLSTECKEDVNAYQLHPAILDIATGFAIELIEGYRDADLLYVPMSYGRIRVYDRLPARVFSHVRSDVANNVSRDFVTFDATIVDEAGNVLVEVERFVLRKVSGEFGRDKSPRPNDLGGEMRDNLSPGELLFLEMKSAGIGSDEGLAALERVLELPETAHNIVVSSIDLDVVSERLAHVKPSSKDTNSVSFSRPNLSSPYEAPRDEIERRLSECWEELLGAKGIGIHDDFFELGGHSLIAIRLFARIKKLWGVEFPISVLTQAPTIATCADLLRDEIGECTPDENHVPVLLSASRRYKYLVPMNQGTDLTKPPFFLVAGMFGNVLNLRHLAGHLGADQPVYAIQARGLHGDDKPHTRFEDMARDYLDEIRQIQSSGPYYLGGFSGGGISAYEMAHQLNKGGERVEMLVLLDTPAPPAYTPQLTKRDRFWIQSYRLRRQGMRYLVAWARRRWQWEMRRFRKVETPELTPAEFRSEEIHVAFLNALRHYKLPIYGGDIHLFRPRLQETYPIGDGRFASDARIIVDDQNHWGPYISGRIYVHEVTGDHDSMVLEPHVRALARDLRNCLQTAQARSIVAQSDSDSAPLEIYDSTVITAV